MSGNSERTTTTATPGGAAGEFALDRDTPELRHLLATPAQGRAAAAVAYLAADDPPKVHAAVWVLTQMAGRVVPYLASEASDAGKAPLHRLRILAVLHRVGLPLDVDSWLTLHTAISTERDQEVRQRAARLLADLGGAVWG